MVEYACEGLAGVSESQIEMNANIQFYDGISTNDIQEILVRSANDLISLDNPNYQFVAARLLTLWTKEGCVWRSSRLPSIHGRSCKKLY